MSRTDTPTPAHPSRLALERLLLGLELDVAHAQACPVCETRLERMRTRDAAFLERFPSLDALRARSPASATTPGETSAGWRTGWRTGWRLALAASLAAAVLAVVVGRLITSPPQQGLRTKGDSIVEMAVSRGGESFLHDPARRLRRGDVLAFRYTTRKQHLLLVSLEQSGKVNVYLTDEAGRSSMRIRPGREVQIKRGVELDDYAGSELVLVLLSNEPLEVDQVRALLLDRFHSLSTAGRAKLELGHLPLEGEQFRWVIRKVER